MKVLVIDDDKGLRRSAQLILEDAEHEVTVAPDGSSGLDLADEVRPDLILCDVRMPGISGLEFLERYRAASGEALVIVMTAYGSQELAVEAMKAGAYDYLPKPFGADELLLALRKAEEREQLTREVVRLREEVEAGRRFGELIAGSPGMTRAVELARKVAPHDSPVLITGASGTGKEMLARLVHRESPRGGGPFVAVNCGAIPEALLESEFFGHLKGAFTGAERDRQGLFVAAHGGTLFLDEVGELPPSLQVKLLRALQEGEVRPVGGDLPTDVDVRVVAATNRDLAEAIREGEFREDLYYRLAVVPIHLPPLKERSDDLPELAYVLLRRHAERLGLPVTRIDPEAMKMLLAYSWPGNVRELENVLERAAVVASDDTVRCGDLPETVRAGLSSLTEEDEAPTDDLSVKRATARLEKALIQRALARTEGNRTEAAALLELSARALRYKIRDYGLE